MTRFNEYPTWSRTKVHFETISIIPDFFQEQVNFNFAFSVLIFISDECCANCLPGSRYFILVPLPDILCFAGVARVIICCFSTLPQSYAYCYVVGRTLSLIHEKKEAWWNENVCQNLIDVAICWCISLFLLLFKFVFTYKIYMENFLLIKNWWIISIWYVINIRVYIFWLLRVDVHYKL